MLRYFTEDRSTEIKVYAFGVGGYFLGQSEFLPAVIVITGGFIVEQVLRKFV